MNPNIVRGIVEYTSAGVTVIPRPITKTPEGQIDADDL